jgi:hypothetical protein
MNQLILLVYRLNDKENERTQRNPATVHEIGWLWSKPNIVNEKFSITKWNISQLYRNIWEWVTICVYLSPLYWVQIFLLLPSVFLNHQYDCNAEKFTAIHIA